MTQIVTRLTDDLTAAVDKLVAEGVVTSRSDAVRAGLHTLLDQHRHRIVGDRIVDGYRRQPQTPEELAGLDEATAALIAEEPW